eukprot:TRINITY_DN76910_c0_g1_i1.p1 TRINITY_DN76910_c0_g1~~TRINITY_DN76910_c0_g1_i1.p1  ORF type:complete len:157 (-),score=12.26 TRINITY_DN76910_c0_g1_i1:118-534(-)
MVSLKLKPISFNVEDFSTIGLPAPQPMTVFALPFDKKLHKYYKSTLGATYMKPIAQLHKGWIMVTGSTSLEQRVYINDVFGSYDNFIGYLSSSPIFRESALKRYAKAVADKPRKHSQDCRVQSVRAMIKDASHVRSVC